MHKDLAKLARTVTRKEGWTVEHTKNGHLRWTDPQGRYLITGTTPGRDGLTNSIRKIDMLREGRIAPGTVVPEEGK